VVSVLEEDLVGGEAVEAPHGITSWVETRLVEALK